MPQHTLQLNAMATARETGAANSALAPPANAAKTYHGSGTIAAMATDSIGAVATATRTRTVSPSWR